MSKSLTYLEIEISGLKLTQMEAQRIHSRINEIAQGRHESGEVFEKPVYEQMKQANDVKESHGITSAKPEGDIDSKIDAPIVQKKLVAGNFNKKGNTLAEDGYKIGDLYPRIEVKQDSGENDGGEDSYETTEFIVTEQNLEEKPFWLNEGAKVGDIINVPNKFLEEKSE